MSKQEAIVSLVSDFKQLLTYGIPKQLEKHIALGTPVLVPLGKRTAKGYVVAYQQAQQQMDYVVKAILSIEQRLPVLPEQHLQFLQRSAEYYRSSISDFISLSLAPGVGKAPRVTYKLLDTPSSSAAIKGQLAQQLVEKLRQGEATAGSLARKLQRPQESVSSSLERLVKHGIVTKTITQSTSGYRMLKAIQTLENEQQSKRLKQKAPKTYALWQKLPTMQVILVSQLEKEYPGAASKLRVLEKNDLVKSLYVPDPRYAITSDAIAGSQHSFSTSVKALLLNSEQQQCLHDLEGAMQSGVFSPYLLQGVTGSGKTEVYLQAIEKMLTQDSRQGDTREIAPQALVLVPEIALTPQLLQRFIARFGADQVGIWHSELNQSQRRYIWQQATEGSISILVGARSALFVPLPGLRMIVVDEEHDSSYKQDENPRYHGRDLAIMRASVQQCLVVMGSATPSLESLHNVDKEKYQFLELPKRATTQTLPEVTVLDMKEHKYLEEPLLSVPLLDAIEDVLTKKQQAILFLNRRGFAPYVMCHDCGHAFMCPDCAVSLTLHLKRSLLLCHYCGYQLPQPETCPDCQGYNVRQMGLGTERLEIALSGKFPQASIARLDRDTVDGRQQLEQVLTAFGNHEVDILLGTQMVTKGHDFPGVTLVGVINADAALNIPDFRAAERSFQLLTQVAGRAGRGELPGKVIIQTYNPEHYAVVTAANQNYQEFIAHELHLRQVLHYPPYWALALIRTEDEHEAQAKHTITSICTILEKSREALSLQSIELLGPVPAPISRLRGRYRFQLMIKAPNKYMMQTLLRVNIRQLIKGKTRLIIDVDPMNMM